MTVTLELPDELQNELAGEAARLGISLPDYIVTVLTQSKPGSNPPRNGAELIEYWQQEGLIGSRAEISDSQEHARQLRKLAETRIRE